MSENAARAEPLHADTMRVRYLIAVEVGGSRRDAGTYEADVTPDEAKALVAAGRAEILGEPLKISDEERAALPKLSPVSDGAAMVQGRSGERPDDAHPGTQLPGQDVPPARSEDDAPHGPDSHIP